MAFDLGEDFGEAKTAVGRSGRPKKLRGGRPPEGRPPGHWPLAIFLSNFTKGNLLSGSKSKSPSRSIVFSLFNKSNNCFSYLLTMSLADRRGMANSWRCCFGAGYVR